MKDSWDQKYFKPRARSCPDSCHQCGPQWWGSWWCRCSSASFLRCRSWQWAGWTWPAPGRTRPSPTVTDKAVCQKCCRLKKSTLILQLWQQYLYGEDARYPDGPADAFQTQRGHLGVVTVLKTHAESSQEGCPRQLRNNRGGVSCRMCGCLTLHLRASACVTLNMGLTCSRCVALVKGAWTWLTASISAFAVLAICSISTLYSRRLCFSLATPEWQSTAEGHTFAFYSKNKPAQHRKHGSFSSNSKCQKERS